MSDRLQESDTSLAFACVGDETEETELQRQQERKERKERKEKRKEREVRKIREGREARPSSTRRSSASARGLTSSEETLHPLELQGRHQSERIRREDEETVRPPELQVTHRQEPSDEDAKVPGGPVLTEPQGPPAITNEQSSKIADLEKPSQEDEEIRRRLEADEELQRRMQALFLVATLAALVLLLVVGVILAVTTPLTINKNIISLPTAAPTACTSRECLLAEMLLQNEVLDAEAIQDLSSPQFRALEWLANDTAVLDLDSTPPATFVERYVLAVFFFATSGKGWSNEYNFLSASSVCAWNNGENVVFAFGVLCNQDDSVSVLYLGKSMHEEVIVASDVFVKTDLKSNVSRFLAILLEQGKINSRVLFRPNSENSLRWNFWISVR
jgi:hypothetical protein